MVGINYLQKFTVVIPKKHGNNYLQISSFPQFGGVLSHRGTPKSSKSWMTMT